MKMYKRISFGLLMILILVSTSIAGATSLWSDTSPAATMFADRKARAVGDTITVIIKEETTAEHKAATSTKKSTETDVKAGIGPLYKAIVPANAEYGDKYDSSGSTTRNNTLEAKVTVQVIEVKPNGNLIVSGTQAVQVNGENQKITVSGTIRPDDISPENTVLSTALADASIKVDGKGSIGSKQKPGILSRVFGWLF